jgi:hypothetical protein
MPISIATPAMASAAIVDPVPGHRHAVLECVDQLPEPEHMPAKQYPHTGTACEADSNDGADATGQKI